MLRNWSNAQRVSSKAQSDQMRLTDTFTEFIEATNVNLVNRISVSTGMKFIS